MTIRITAVRMVENPSHQHIGELKWANISTGATGANTRGAIISWLDADSDNRAQVGTGPGAARVYVARPASGESWLQTYADGQWTNNLLSLPRYERRVA